MNARSAGERQAPAEHPTARELSRLASVLVACGAADAVGAVLAVSGVSWLSSIGILTITGLTGLAAGAAAGFLFGIPRTLSDAAQAAPAVPAVQPEAQQADSGSAADDPAPRRFLSTNSNLEQISDWLTKIIVGVTLVELREINNLLVEFRDLVASLVPRDDQSTPVAACIVLLFGLIVGFLWMYLETRINLSRIFNNVEDMLSGLRQAVRSAQAQAQEAHEQAERSSGVAASLSSVVADISAGPVASAATLAPAASALKAAAQLSPDNEALKGVAAHALAASGRTDEASKLLDAGSTTEDSGVLLNRMLVALYKAPPDGFREAIDVAEALAKRPDVAGNGDFWFYRAAAYGQSYHYARLHGAGQDELAATAAQVVASAERAISVNPRYRVALLRLADPSTSDSPSDDDLADLKDYPPLRLLLYPGSPSKAPETSAEAGDKTAPGGWR